MLVCWETLCLKVRSLILLSESRILIVVYIKELVFVYFMSQDTHLETGRIAGQCAMECLELGEILWLGCMSAHDVEQEGLEVLEVPGDFGRVVWIEERRITGHRVEDRVHAG